jgi:hypothetical protein
MDRRFILFTLAGALVMFVTVLKLTGPRAPTPLPLPAPNPTATAAAWRDTSPTAVASAQPLATPVGQAGTPAADPLAAGTASYTPATPVALPGGGTDAPVPAGAADPAHLVQQRY